MRAISPSVQFTGGTTELIITPLIASRSSPASVNRFRVSTPYSSTVCCRAVVNRQLAINSSPRKTPNTVFVLPTSMVSSIGIPFGFFSANSVPLVQFSYRTSATSPEITVTCCPPSRVTWSKPSGPSPAVIPTKLSLPLVTRTFFAARVTRDRREALDDVGCAIRQKSIVVALEFAQQAHQQFQPGLRFSRF